MGRHRREHTLRLSGRHKWFGSARASAVPVVGPTTFLQRGDEFERPHSVRKLVGQSRSAHSAREW
jgi:hypothetical protein